MAAPDLVSGRDIGVIGVQYYNSQVLVLLITPAFQNLYACLRQCVLLPEHKSPDAQPGTGGPFFHALGLTEFLVGWLMVNSVMKSIVVCFVTIRVLIIKRS